MKKKGPKEKRTDFLNRLKRQRIRDTRFTPDEETDQRAAELHSRGKNLLLRTWQISDRLAMYSKMQANGQDPFYPVAPLYEVDDDTTLVTMLFEDEWTVYLIWPSGPDYCLRLLTEQEADKLSEWSHRILRSRLGLDFPEPIR